MHGTTSPPIYGASQQRSMRKIKMTIKRRAAMHVYDLPVDDNAHPVQDEHRNVDAITVAINNSTYT